LPRSSFLKIEKAIEMDMCVDNACMKRRLRSSGSGAVVKTTFSGAYVLTAAHVCDDSDIIAQIKKDMPGVKLNIEFDVITLDGSKYSVDILDMDHKNDICILWVQDLYEPPILIATKAPEPGEHVYNLAAPLGVHDVNMVPIFDGFYNGRDNKGAALYSIPAFGGSSGSPIINTRGELVGMIHSTLRHFPQIAISPNYKAMRAFINNTIEEDGITRITNVFLNVFFR
jgi:S1-C subfamily serine protease